MLYPSVVLLYYTNTNHLYTLKSIYNIYYTTGWCSRSEIVIESTLLHVSSAVFGYSIIILAYIVKQHGKSKQGTKYLCVVYRTPYI